MYSCFFFAQIFPFRTTFGAMAQKHSFFKILVIVLFVPMAVSAKDDSRFFAGGGIGLSFGSVTSVRINPFVGYRILPKTSAGVGAVYEYYNYNAISTSIYGGSVFGEQYLGNNFFVHAEYELLSLETAYFDKLELHTGQERFLHHGILVGGGYRQQLSDAGSLFILALFNLNQTANSPYGMPIIKVGFSFN